MKEYLNNIEKAAQYLEKKIENKPEIAIVLGSGQGDFAQQIENAVHVPYAEIPGFKTSTVAGHSGEWVLGTLKGKQVAVMAGRLHYYEGYSLRDVTFPVRVMAKLGIKTLVVTNAAGGIDTAYEVGNLMLISDHINFTAANPLFGANLDEFGPRFLDMSKAYDGELRRQAQAVAAQQGLSLREGVYAQMPGPSYETPAEIRMLRAMGADAVGMSTVPEVVVARHCGIRVLGISCITNMAAGVLDQPLSHAEVIAASKKVKGVFQSLLTGLIEKI